MTAELPLVFVLDSRRDYGAKLAQHLGTGLAEYGERIFEDGEHKLRPLADPADRDTVVVISLYDEPERGLHDKLCGLLFFIRALKDGMARRVSVIAPYLCYARQDRKVEANDPLTLRYVAELLESAGADRVCVLDVHNPAALENAFRIRAENIEAAPLLAAHLAAMIGDAEIAVVSPDVGGMKRAERFRTALGAITHRSMVLSAMGKRRIDHIVGMDEVVGAVGGRTAVIVDDMIASGATLLRAAEACRKGGARGVFAAATHGLFLQGGARLFGEAGLDGVVVTDSVPPFRVEPAARAKLHVLDSTLLIAAAIRRPDAPVRRES